MNLFFFHKFSYRSRSSLPLNHNYYWSPWSWSDQVKFRGQPGKRHRKKKQARTHFPVPTRHFFCFLGFIYNKVIFDNHTGSLTVKTEGVGLHFVEAIKWKSSCFIESCALFPLGQAYTVVWLTAVPYVLVTHSRLIPNLLDQKRNVNSHGRFLH